MSSTAFSENLVSLHSISYLSNNQSVQYWKKMRPLGDSKVWKPGEVAPMVVHTLQEWSEFSHYLQGVPVFLGQIGKMFDGTWKPIVLDVLTKLSARVVYSLRKEHVLISALKRMVSHCVVGEEFVFCFQNAQVVKLRGNHACVLIHVRVEDVQPSQCILYGRDKDGMLLMTPRGLLSVPVETNLDKYLFIEYATTFGLSIDKYGIEQGKLTAREMKIIKMFENKRKTLVANSAMSPLDWGPVSVREVLKLKEKKNIGRVEAT